MTTTSTTTAATVPSSELATLERGCEMDGKYYADGAQVASDANKPCELCYCIRNRTACVMQECILHVEGCRPVFEPGVCCPVRYQCDAALDYDTTTTGAGIGGLISTTISSIIGGISSTPQPGGCVKDGEYYADGSLIPHLDDDPCNHCYCMRGDVSNFFTKNLYPIIMCITLSANFQAVYKRFSPFFIDCMRRPRMRKPTRE